MKNVQLFLEEQKQARKEFRAQQAKEREAMAINVLADTHEVLKALECEYLLKQETKEVIVEKEIEVIKEVEVEKIVKVEDTKEIERLSNIITDLKQQMSKMQPISQIDDGVEVLKQTLKAKDKYIAELEKQLAVKETITEELVNNCYDDEDYLQYLAEQEYIEEEEVIEEPIQPAVKEEKIVAPITTDVFVKQLKVNISKYNGSARIYQTDKCYLIASPTTDEITWISNEELTDEYKTLIESKLVDEFKFLPARTKLSPIAINRENGYMARVSAKEGYENFSMKDILSGYVKLDNKFYLYSYSPAGTKVFVEDFDKKRRGEAKTYPYGAGIKDRVVAVVLDMYKEYKTLIDTKKVEEEKKAEETAKKFNEKQAARDKQREADAAIVAQLKNKKDRKEIVKQTISTMSDSLEELSSQLF